MRRYHAALGVPIESMPLAMPVSLRTDDDPVGGNRFAGARIAAPVGEPDPAKRIATIRELVLDRRQRAGDQRPERRSAPVLARLPTPVLTALAGAGMATDVQASNVPGLSRAAVHRRSADRGDVAFGPLPGVPMMVVLVSPGRRVLRRRALRHGRRSPTTDLFARCLREGFDEMLALDPGRAAPPPSARPSHRPSTPPRKRPAAPSGRPESLEAPARSGAAS